MFAFFKAVTCKQHLSPVTRSGFGLSFNLAGEKS